MTERGIHSTSDEVTTPRKGKRGQGGRAPPAEIEQLQDRRVTTLKRKREQVHYREASQSIDNSVQTVSGATNTANTANMAPVPSGRSSYDSLDNSVGARGERFYLSPAIDLERLKAVYCPVRGPVRMQTCWLPPNLSVSQPEFDDAQMEECARGDGDVKQNVQGSVDSRTIDMEDTVESSGEGSPRRGRGASSLGNPKVVKDTTASLEEGAKKESGKGVKVDSIKDAPRNTQAILQDEEPIVVESHGGYRSAMGTHGFHQGTYVYEVKVACDVSEKKGFGIRFGWATKGHDLERILHQPVAAIHGDGYGLNVVNMGHEEGSVFYSLHKGVKKELPLSKSTRNVVRKGDVFGVVLHLGDKGRPFETTQDDIVLYRKTQQNHIKSPGPDWMNERKPLSGSYLELFWNGKSQGRVFQDEILESTYYPMVSLYTNLKCLPFGDKDPEQRARVQVTFRSGAFAHVYPKGVKSLEHKVIW